MSDAIVTQILKKPNAADVAAQLNVALEEENKQRIAFRQRIDETIKAEFINAEIVLHAPVKMRHWRTSSLLATLLNVYATTKNRGIVGVEKVMIALTRNDYEPDICFFGPEKANHFTDNQMLFPAPDFVVEILSKSTSKNDRTVKKDDYAAHDIKEYWIIDTEKKIIEQYLLTGTSKKYAQPHTYSVTDEIESRVILGFKIPVAAIFDEVANASALLNLLK